MASFFDELGKKITQTGQDAVKKTKDMAEIAKLNNSISSEHGRVHTLMYELGKAYFEANRDDETSPYAEQMKLIKQSFAKIHEYNNEVKKLKGVRQCEQCGAEISASAIFCTLCGAKQTQAPPNNQGQTYTQAPPNNQEQTYTQAPPNNQQQTYNQTPLNEQQQAYTQDASTDQMQAQSYYRQSQPEIVQNVCPNCGKAVSEGTSFCTSCGTAIKQQ